jgi:iron complex outermembrane receptor protein
MQKIFHFFFRETFISMKTVKILGEDHMNKYPALVKALLLCGVAMVPVAASAQDATGTQNAPSSAGDAGTADIVVTALRRDTTLQRTPAAVTALSGQELASRGISNVEDLAAAVPAVTFGKNIGQAHIAIRGIGSDSVVAGQDPRVAFYQDGVYIARPDAQLSGMFDVDSVQVLKGPQGTLYGRNATGGAIVITGARPTDEMRGYVRAGYGNYNALNIEMATSGPVSDTLSVRFAGKYERHDGYGKNIITGTDIDDKDEIGVRGSVLWKPVEGLELLTILDYSNESDRANGLHYFGNVRPGAVAKGLLLGGTALLNSRNIASDIDPKVHIRTWGIAEHVTYDAGWATFKSITAYRKVQSSNLVDIDGTSIQLGFDELFNSSKQFSEELTIDGKVNDRLSWLLGGQYFYEDIGPSGSEIPISSAAIGGPLNPVRDAFFAVGFQKTYGLAAYGQLSYELVDGLKLTVGGRYSTEKKKLDDNFQLDFSRPWTPGGPLVSVPGFPRHLEDRFSRFTPTATIEYQVTPDVFAYFTYSQGFKSGGYAFGVNQPAYRPEKITNFEGGIKTTFMNGMVTANLIGFHYDYTDLQVTQVRGNVSVTENAASAKVDGLEAELVLRPVRGVSIGGNYAYVDAKYKDFISVDPSSPIIANCVAGGFGTLNSSGQCAQNLSGNRMSQAPKHSFMLYASGTMNIGDNKLILRGDYNYKSKQFFTPFENDLVSQKGYGILSSSLRLEGEAGWSVEGYVRNITDKKAVAQVYVSSLPLFGSPVLGTLTAPRTYGVTLGYKF